MGNLVNVYYVSYRKLVEMLLFMWFKFLTANKISFCKYWDGFYWFAQLGHLGNCSDNKDRRCMLLHIDLYILYLHIHIRVSPWQGKCSHLNITRPWQKLNVSDSSQQRSAVSQLPKLLGVSSQARTHKTASDKGALQKGSSGKVAHPMLGNFLSISQYSAMSISHRQYCLSFFLRCALNFSL